MQNIVVRSAQLEDVRGIVDLVNGYAGQAIMLPRTPESVELALDSFLVATDNHGDLLGCGSLKEYSPSVAEVAAVAVVPQAHGRGIGSAIVSAVESLAAKRGIDELFALTMTPAFFESMGYAAAERARYPEKIRRDCFKCPRRIRCNEACVSKIVSHADLAAAA